jgi:hypothetical protein
MDSDLDTSTVLTILERLAEEILGAAHAGHDVRAAQVVLRVMSGVFGLRLDAEGPESRVSAGWNEHLKRFAPQDVPR